MDLQWLLPQQIDQILKFCQLSAVQDLTMAANILETHHWDMEKAMYEVVDQNDSKIKQKKQEKSVTQPMEHSSYVNSEVYSNYQAQKYQNFEQNKPKLTERNTQKPRTVDPEHIRNSNILAQQNFQYEQMHRKMIKEQQEADNIEKERQRMEQEFIQGQKQFQNRQITGETITIKFRLANKVSSFTFSLEDKIEFVFKYVSCCLRDGFENRFSQFDLTQSFPYLSLQSRKRQTLAKVFEDSKGQVLMVKQL